MSKFYWQASICRLIHVHGFHMCSTQNKSTVTGEDMTIMYSNTIVLGKFNKDDILLSYLTVETFLKEKRGGGEKTDCESVNM